MSMYYLELTYEGAKIGDDTPSIIITTTIPVKLPVAAHVLREGAQNRYTQDVLWSLAEVQGIDPETVKLRSATLDRRFHPSLSEEDVIQKAKGYLIAESDYGGGALHIQRDGDVCLFADDAAAAAAAEADGVKLIKDLPLGPGDKDFAFYVDTPENRRRLGEYLAWERRISWDGFSGDRMYIRIGNNEMDMGAAISMLAEAMGVKDPVAAIDVAIGRECPLGKSKRSWTILSQPHRQTRSIPLSTSSFGRQMGLARFRWHLLSRTSSTGRIRRHASITATERLWSGWKCRSSMTMMRLKRTDVKPSCISSTATKTRNTPSG